LRHRDVGVFYVAELAAGRRNDPALTQQAMIPESAINLDSPVLVPYPKTNLAQETPHKIFTEVRAPYTFGKLQDSLLPLIEGIGRTKFVQRFGRGSITT
jgi:hypothetical protein